MLAKRRRSAVLATMLIAGIALHFGGAALAADKAVATPPALGQPKAGATGASGAVAKLVDINSASRAELKTLPGIGDAEAARIIAARPYPSKAKLVADKVLSDELYMALKGRIVAIPKEPPARRKPEPTAMSTHRAATPDRPTGAAK
jgi:competence protein ComEA